MEDKLMFCEKCGTEITGNEKFCGKCGTPVVNTNHPTFTLERFKTLLTDKTPLGSLALTFVVTAVLQLIMLVLRFVPFGKYYVAVEDLDINRGGRYSINELLGSSGGSTIFVILVLISIILCILPVLKDSFDKRRKMILPKIAAFWNALTIAIGIWSLADCVTSNKERVADMVGEEFFTGSWSLTFGGWLNVLVTLAIIVLLFVITKKADDYMLAKSREEATRKANLPLSQQPIPTGGWRCVCGRPHAAYESSCICGASKNDVRQEYN